MAFRVRIVSGALLIITNKLVTTGDEFATRDNLGKERNTK